MFFRSLFVLDRKVPEFDVSNRFYKNIFKQDLNLVVIKEGNVGTFIPVPIAFKDISKNAQLVSNVIDQKNINYLSVNLLDETILPNEDDLKVELGNIDYSGVTNNGQRVMGLARIDNESYKLIPDPILSWAVPENWSLEDAATVPHAYVSVRGNTII